MAKKNLMGWIRSRATWQKKHKGKLYCVSCRQLDAPPTKAGSMAAANDWWEGKLAEITEEAIPPPLFTPKAI